MPRYSNDPAKRKVAVAALRDYDQTYLECRDLRHHWSNVGFFREGRNILRRAQCLRCGSSRTDTWSAQGLRLTSRYNYTSEFKLPPGWRGDDIRREVLKRVDVFDSEDEMFNALFTPRSSARVPAGRR